jgi:hypothetical protein
MPPRARSAGLATLVVVALAAGCADLLGVKDIPPAKDGGGQAESGAASDAGVDATTDGGGGSPDGADASATDSAEPVPCGDGGGPLPDGAVAPSGTLLYSSCYAQLEGVTSDDFVIFLDGTSDTTTPLYALSTQPGSAPISLGSADNNNDVAVLGKVVLIGNSGSMQSIGSLSAWTSAAKSPTMLSAAAAPFGSLAYAASADGSEVLFVDAVDLHGAGTLTIAAPDGTGRKALVQDVDTTGNYCGLSLAFSGDQAVAAYCLAQPDGGAPAGGTVTTLAAFAGPSWSLRKLASGVGLDTGLVVDTPQSRVIANGPAGTVAYPLDGGAATTLDPTGEPGAFFGLPGVLGNDGGSLFYTTNAQALDRAATTPPPSPTELVFAGSFADVFAVSPDQAWVVGGLFGMPGQSDLYLASALGPGPATTLTTDTTSGLLGPAFTADSSHALFFTSLDSVPAGTLTVAPVGAGVTATPRTLGSSCPTVATTTGAKVIFACNLEATGYAGDLFAADTSQAAAPTLLVSRAVASFFFNVEKTELYYTVWGGHPGELPGLWRMPVP